MRVLIIEDERDTAVALQRGFEADGFAVDVAEDGRHGLWLAQNNPYAAIVLDLMLPGMNGYVVCSELRRSGSNVPAGSAPSITFSATVKLGTSMKC